MLTDDEQIRLIASYLPSPDEAKRTTYAERRALLMKFLYNEARIAEIEARVKQIAQENGRLNEKGN
jgi:predicted nuclease with TOPRIM domain